MITKLYVVSSKVFQWIVKSYFLNFFLNYKLEFEWNRQKLNFTLVLLKVITCCAHTLYVSCPHIRFRPFLASNTNTVPVGVVNCWFPSLACSQMTVAATARPTTSTITTASTEDASVESSATTENLQYKRKSIKPPQMQPFYCVKFFYLYIISKT